MIIYLDDGSINFKKVTEKYEYIDDDDPFWNRASNWIEIDALRTNEKFKGKGSILLKQFIDKLPNDIGVVLNAVPLDNDISFENLQKWYIKNGFKQISKDNISLYLVKTNGKNSRQG